MKIWVGRRESDILSCKNKVFDYSITFYGSNDKENNFSYCAEKRVCAKYEKEFYVFVNACISTLTKDILDYEIYFYNNTIGKRLEKVNPLLKQHFKNCNNYELLEWLNNKSYTRFWLSNSVSVPPYTLLSASECSYNDLKKKFPFYSEFIIQRNYSSGGSGTYHLTEYNEVKIQNLLSINEPYLVSPYISQSISACCHVIIGKNTNLIFPIGFQIISENTDKMSYLGTSFVKPDCKTINYKEVYIFIEKISKRLAKNGYRGICGYDFLIKDNKILLIEINPRYMASSYLINYALEDNNLPTLFDFNEMAFKDDLLLSKYENMIANLKIPYKTYTQYYRNNSDLEKPSNSILYLDDGLENVKEFDENVYLYRYITN